MKNQKTISELSVQNEFCTRNTNCQKQCVQCNSNTLSHNTGSFQKPESGPKTAKVLHLNPTDFPGGIAMWGALSAVYNTSIAPDEFGVHIHARMKVGGIKSIDETFDIVEVQLPDIQNVSAFKVNGDDAAHYNIATILGVALTCIMCPKCEQIHSDTDWELVHPHTGHTCKHCDHRWTTDDACVSNPMMKLKELCDDAQQNRIIIDPVQRNINQPQSRFPGGVQVWGSNPAIVWTSPKPEEGGLHFHAFVKRRDVPDVDETYGTVTLDGFLLDAEQVRHLMAQQGLPFLDGHIKALKCPWCEEPHFDRFSDAVSPHVAHTCEQCALTFSASDDAVVSNPVLSQLEQLTTNWNNEMA